jgi:hypothetical protein
LKDSPSLQPTVTTVITEEMAEARREATAVLADNGETPRTGALIAYSEGQVLGDWLPE